MPGKPRLVVILWLAIVLLVVVPIVVVFVNRPIFTLPVIPVPNGYETVSKAGSMVTALPSDFAESEDVKQLQTFLDSNLRPLRLLDTARTQEFVVPIDYEAGIGAAGEQVGPSRQAMRLLYVDGRIAQLDGEYDRAGRVFAKLFLLGTETANGGVLIHLLVASAFERMGLEGLLAVSDQLSVSAKAELREALQNAARAPSDLAPYLNREQTLLKIEHGTLYGMYLINVTGSLQQPAIQRTKAVDAEIVSLYEQVLETLGDP